MMKRTPPMSDFSKVSEALGDAASRRENELLLLCVHASVTEDEAARIRELAAFGLDWDYAFRFAERHAVLPLFYRRLEDHANDAAPQSVRLRLRERFRANATRNLLLAGELARIARLFDEEGVALLAYKGPALAVSAYGDLTLRRFIDLDIIVRPSDVQRASALLRTLGFCLPGGLSEAHMNLLLRSQHNVAFTRDGGRLMVELHWGVSAARFADVRLERSAWERARGVELCGERIKCLSPEDSVLALCVHGTKHLWERLAWICDVGRLLDADLDWNYLSRAAEDSGTVRMLLLGLCLASELTGAKIPLRVRDKIVEDRAVSGLSAWVLRRLFDGAEYAPASLFGSIGFNLRARRRLREKLSYFSFIFTPTDGDMLALKLPDGLAFGYYFVRPFRLLLLRGGAGH